MPDKWSRMPNDKEVMETAEAIKSRGINAIIVQNMKQALEEIKKLSLQDSCLVLFGSYVLNKQTKSSDVDLLLITKNKTAPAKIRSLLLNYNIKTDLNVLNFEQYQKALSNRGFNLVNQVLNKHIIFKNPELYWELTLRGLKNGNRY
mgnify:CR=1 FL=1